MTQLTKIETGIIEPQSLGSNEFKKTYKTKYAYCSGAMVKGIASADMVIRMGKAGFLGFLGTGAWSIAQIEEAIKKIQSALPNGEPYGINLLCNLMRPEFEDQTVDLYFKYGVKVVDAAAYTQPTSAIVRYRVKGLKKNPDGSIHIEHHVIGKISRPEVAAHFLSPAPEKTLIALLSANKITQEEFDCAKLVPLADDLTVEADSGGHTDGGILTAILPAIMVQRDEAMKKFNFQNRIRIGAAGGIGSPEAVAAAYIMGADYVLTGSINQCTVEAGTSDLSKDILQELNVQDTDMAPAGDMFEIGAKVQVVKKGTFFPARGTKLYDLYKNLNSLEEIDPATKSQIETKYFKKTFEEIWQGTKEYFQKINAPDQIKKAEENPKHKMALVFRWYFGLSTNWAISGEADKKVDFQIHCGPAMGAFNQWVKGSKYENWRNRHVDEVGMLLMKGAAKIIENKIKILQGLTSAESVLSVRPESL